MLSRREASPREAPRSPATGLHRDERLRREILRVARDDRGRGDARSTTLQCAVSSTGDPFTVLDRDGGHANRDA